MIQMVRWWERRVNYFEELYNIGLYRYGNGMEHEERIKKLEKATVDLRSEMDKVQNNLFLLNSNFSGLNSSWAFVAQNAKSTSESLERISKKFDRMHRSYLKEIVHLSDKIDVLLPDENK